MPEIFDLVVRAPRAVLPVQGEAAREVGVRRGRIAAIEPLGALLPAKRTIELDADTVLLPGLVDSHVHVNEPGHTDWEGFETATAAAAAGGVTTVLDMPLNSIPVTTDVRALEAKLSAARGKCHVDVGFWGGLVPGNLGELPAMREAGVVGFKCFLVDSGLAEFAPVDAATLEAALDVVRRLDCPLVVHAESMLGAPAAPALRSRRYADYLAAHPRGHENLGISLVIEAARATGGHAHVCHLSSSDALPMIASARHEGVNLTVESCPHYLSLCAEEIPDGATLFKCCPPIRESSNRELLWDGLGAGLIDMVVSDHSPSTLELKDVTGGDFGIAWGGICSLQLRLPVTWTAARERGFSLPQVVGWTAEGPAMLGGLRSKGAIAVGKDADFCVFAPDELFLVDSSTLRHRNPGSPYEGHKLAGVVRMTILRGEPVEPGSAAGRFLDSRTA